MAIVTGVNWTYSGDPGASPKDAVRFLIGDTDTTDQLLGDEEIDYLVTTAGTTNEAAAQACEAISVGGRLVDKEVDDLVIKARQRSEQYQKLASALRKRRVGSRMGVFAGGVSISDKESRRTDTDVPSPAFNRGQFDNPEVTQQGDGYSYLTSSSTRVGG